MNLVYLKDVAVFSAAQTIAGVALLGYTFISARLLGRADYGLFQAVMGIYGIFIVVGSSLNIVTLHLIAKAESDARPFVLGALVRVALVIGGACSLLLIVLSSYFANVLHTETLWPFVCLAGLVVAETLLTTFYGGVQGRNLYSFFSTAKSVESLLVVGLGTTSIIAGAGVAGAVSGYFGGMALVSLFFLTRRDLYSFRQGSYSTHIDMYSITRPLAVFGTLLFVVNAPMIIARARLTEEAAGLFGTLYSLRNTVLPFAFAVALPLYSHTVSRRHEPRMVLKALLLVVMFAGAFLAVGAISPRWFIQTLYGSDFVEASAYMIAYGFYLLLHMICMVVMFRQAAASTLTFALLLIPIIIVATLVTLPNLSIRKILITQIVAWIAYLGSSLCAAFPAHWSLSDRLISCFTKMDTTKYQARTHYQQDDVALNYDDERFSSWHGKLAHQMESRALKYAIDNYFEPEGTILDLPCGTGRLLHAYHDGNFRVIGADISDKMLAVAQARFKDNSLFSFRTEDAEALSFVDNSLDYLVSFRLMCHLPANVRGAVLAEMIRVTRHVLVINYHFDVRSPLMLFNRVFRRQFLPYPLRERDLKNEIQEIKNVELCEIRKLSWCERSSALVVLRKHL